MTKLVRDVEESTSLSSSITEPQQGNNDEDKNGLVKRFVDLKQTLKHIDDLRSIDAEQFLHPFLEVVRIDETTGAVTSLALAAICKFLSYGLIDATMPNITTIVENIVDAVTHARFMGTDQSSDGVTLYSVVEVLHTLMRNPEGAFLSNEALCGVMMSCFKICFYEPLNELLRRSAEQTLKDIVQMLFTRLPQFAEDAVDESLVRKLQMTTPTIKPRKGGRWQKDKLFTTSGMDEVAARNEGEASGEVALGGRSFVVEPVKEFPSPATDAASIGSGLDVPYQIVDAPASRPFHQEDEGIMPEPSSSDVITANLQDSVALNPDMRTPEDVIDTLGGKAQSNEYINSVGVRFTQHSAESGAAAMVAGMAAKRPHGLSCIQELFRFLTLICNPKDAQNTDVMMHMGLNLLTVAFEIGADTIGQYETLLHLVKDDLCRNLISQMGTDKLWIFAANLQLSFLLFESLRGHLKFQLEAFLRKLSEVIATDNPKITYEMRELAMEYLLQFCHIPGLMAELYFNYDCDLYCVDLFESVVNLLSKYTLSATNSIYSTHLIAMESLVTVIESIERNCAAAKNGAEVQRVDAAVMSPPPTSTDRIGGFAADNGEGFGATTTPSRDLLNNTMRCNRKGVPERFTRSHLAEVKRKKRTIALGTELFNQRPDKGIQCLQENGILQTPLEPAEVAHFLRENPSLDKKMIGEYISKKKNVDSQILLNFVNSFEFTAVRIDQALRLYLETFRLPGEAPLIFLVLEHFAEHWHSQNGRPFANTDAAFSLAYAIIMLNMDQHNSNAKRLNVPMTQEDFQKNLRGLNGGTDFDQDMLTAVFHSIKNEEIVMPAEQTGVVRENYLWKVLLRRGECGDGIFYYVDDARYDIDLFRVIWGPTLSVLSFIFDKNKDSTAAGTLANFIKCATILSHYSLYEDFDALILTLCKFTTLLQSPQQDPVLTGSGIGPHASSNHSEITQAVQFGCNQKAQEALRTVFCLVHEHGDSLRDSWRHIFDLFLQLFRLKLLPKAMTEVEDFAEPNGKVLLLLRKPCPPKSEGLFSSLYSYLASDGLREPSYEEQEVIIIGKSCIKECQLEQVLQETKFLQLESLQEVLRTLLAAIKPPTGAKTEASVYSDDVVVFWLELLVKIVILNRDRMTNLWEVIHNQISLLIIRAAQHDTDYDYLLNRSVVGLFKLAIYLMRNEELCAMVLQSLKIMLFMPPAVIRKMSKQISIGMYELLKTSAQNIHSEKDWDIIFTILQCVGAGVSVPPTFESDVSAALLLNTGAGLDKDSASADSAISCEDDASLPPDAELLAGKFHDNIQHEDSGVTLAVGGGGIGSSPIVENWIMVNKEIDLNTMSRSQSPPFGKGALRALSSLIYPCTLAEPAPFALFKCWDSLSFIVRNVAHITPYNFDSCVRCIRIFVETCCDGGLRDRQQNSSSRSVSGKRRDGQQQQQQRRSAKATSDLSESEARSDTDDGDLAQRYETLSIQLLDLMYTLYTRTAKIFRWWAEEGCTPLQCSALWTQGWCPLLQGIARLAMDRRREVRTNAISCLQQRALLMPDLQTLSGDEWALCFQQVLFPLLNELLPPSAAIAHLDAGLLEESRVRIATIMSKVFLHHLTPLIALGPAFQDLWLDVLDYVEKFMKVGSDMLFEQMQEILKNMLLVMHSVRLFHNDDGSLCQPLWELTTRRIGEFLPNLMVELFGGALEGGERHQQASPVTKTTMGLPPACADDQPLDESVVGGHPLVTGCEYGIAPDLSQQPGVSWTGSELAQQRYNAILTPELEAVRPSSLVTLQQLMPVSAVPVLVPPQQQTLYQASSQVPRPALTRPQQIQSQPEIFNCGVTESLVGPATCGSAVDLRYNQQPAAAVPEQTMALRDESDVVVVDDRSPAQSVQQLCTATDSSYYAIAIDVPETSMVDLAYNSIGDDNGHEKTVFQNPDFGLDLLYPGGVQKDIQDAFACREHFAYHPQQSMAAAYRHQESVSPNDAAVRMAP